MGGPWLGLDVGSDISLANAMGREIIAAGLANEKFIRHATSGFEAYKAHVEKYTLDRAERETGVPAAAIRQIAHAYARAGAPSSAGPWASPSTTTRLTTWSRSSILRCLPGTSAATAAALNPLRGQNNVQGGGDMGAIPDRLTGFQHVENDRARAKFEKAWGM